MFALRKSCAMYLSLSVSFIHRDGLENFVFLFLDVEIKNTWEAYFENAKQKLGKFNRCER